MQIPIQSLNTVHLKSYDFSFDETVFKYRMSEKEVEQVKLVVENGQEFKFVKEIAGTNEKSNSNC